MSAEHERLKEILAKAAGNATPEARAAFLDVACHGDFALRQQVEALLSAYARAGDFLEKTVELPSPDFVIERTGAMIGRYKLLEKIGEGGFGVVFMAEQTEPVHRKVALKIIKAGMDTREVMARFEAERQALALMDHPNIAHVLDAGATETGRPYFVMELVRGIPITDYCDQKQFPTAQRLQLFMKVCAAVQHAHQKGIIHRDLKPTNILVTVLDGEATPKVIDFGVAKALGQKLTEKTLFTSFQQMIGTPAYMSPEQAELSGVDVDTRSDIYSLGVLLYELLTGVTPFDADTLRKAALDEIRRLIRETEPAKPSTRLTELARSQKSEGRSQKWREVQGDLDWIAMKALEKDRVRRYETANALVEDLRRHLNHEPVLASPPSAAYRARKFIRRHRFGVAMATTLTLALAAGLAAALVGFGQARREQDRAERLARAEATQRRRAEAGEKKAQAEAGKSSQVAQFIKDMLQGVGPGVARGRDTKLLREVLDRTAQRLNKDLAGQPEVEAELRQTVGVVYHDLGEYTNAAGMLREAIAIRRKLHGNEHLDVADSLNWLSVVECLQGKGAEAEKCSREALAIFRRAPGNQNLPVARALFTLGNALASQDTDQTKSEAEAAFREALAIQRKELGNQHSEIALTLQNLGQLLALSPDKQREAEACLREALDGFRRAYGNENIAVAGTLRRLGFIIRRQPGRASEAAVMVREALAINKRMLGDHPEMASDCEALGAILIGEGKYQEAEVAFRDALAMRTRFLGVNNPQLHQTLVNLSVVLLSQARFQEAEEVSREALGMREKLFGSRHPGSAQVRELLADALQLQGKTTELKELYEEAAAEGVDDAWNRLAWILATAMDPKVRDGVAALALAQRMAAANNAKIPEKLDTMAAAYAEAGQFTNAVAVQTEAITLLQDEEQKRDFASRLELYKSGQPYRDDGLLVQQIDALIATEKFAEAEPLARQSLSVRERQLPDDWQRFHARSLLGGCLQGQRKYAEAGPLLQSGYEGMKLREDRIPPSGKPLLKEALQRLVQFYEATNRSEQAEEWKQKLAEFEKAETAKPAVAPSP